MKVRIPLAWKFAGWLLLNLFLLALGAAAFVRAQFNGGFNSVLAGSAGRRVEALALAVATQLRGDSRSSWNSDLEKLGAAYGVPIGIFQNSGSQVAGATLDLPLAIKTELAKPPRPPSDDRPANGKGKPGEKQRPGDGRPPVRDHSDHPPKEGRRTDGDSPGGNQRFDGSQPPPSQDHPHSEKSAPSNPPPRPSDGAPPNAYGDQAAGGAPNTPDSRDGADQPPPAPDPQRWPKFLTHTTTPDAYWIGVRAPLQNLPRGAPLTIIIRCASLAQGGLLLDTKPLVIAGAAAVVVSILIWLPFVFALTRQVRQVTAATAQVARGNFAVRLPVRRSDELGDLASSVNMMAGQLDTFTRGQKRFMGDVAHELSSPIARMQTALAILEESGIDRDPTSYYTSLREELDEMSQLVAELLEFSKASMGREVRVVPVELASLISEVVNREAGGALVECDVPDALSANAEPKLLARALGNVVRNAVRYAGHAGPILISASARPGRVELIVTDTGPGVPPESLPRLFDAFYRPDAARTREAGGTGLGLAIVKTCVEACGGAVAARNGASCGLQVILAFPTGDTALLKNPS